MDGQSKRTISSWRLVGIRICAGIMLAGLACGLLFFARPTSSTLEKRELTPFPTPSVQTFLDGSFFTDVSLWYADTYPLREELVGANQAIQQLYGIQPRIKFVGGNVEADAIGNEAQETPANATQDAAEHSAAQTQWDATEAPDTKPMQEAMQQQIMNGLYIKDGAAYNLFYFVDESAQLYTNAVNSLAEQLAGETTVYSMLVPNGSAVLLSSEERDQLGGSDQKKAIEYFYGKYNDYVVPIGIVDTLAAHSDEYLYFRTDHHWTQLGAYYAYTEFCKLRGFEAANIQSWGTKEFSDFLGTFYTETGDTSLLPDTVYAHIPPQTNDISFVDEAGDTYDSNVVVDVSDWGPGTGYYCYGIGDYPLIHVENPQCSDGSACLLLKDSYGNCLAPQLIGHYQDLWVIDYRYSETDIVAFAREHHITDLIIENNLAIASTEQIAQALYDQVSTNTLPST